VKLSDKIIQFIETLKLTSGSFVRQPVVLRPWQKKIIREVYDYPEVRTALLSVGRKNGKSELVGFLMLAHLWLPGLKQENQQIVLVANDREQAGLVYKVVKNLILMDDELPFEFNIIDSRKKIIHLPSGGELHAASGDSVSGHGLNPSCIALDEIGNMRGPKARDLYDVMTSAFGAQKKGLTWLFSTRSPEENHIFSELIRYGNKVNSGEIEDPSFKSFVHAAPHDCDLMDKKAWKAANPALNDFLSLDYIQKQAEKACKIPSFENSFRQLHLNQMVDAATPFITRKVWMNNASPIREDLKGRRCYAGLDLSSKVDLTSFVLVFPDENDPPKFDVFPFFWKPDENLNEAEIKDKVPYKLWKKQGHLLTTPGKTIGYDYVVKQIIQLAEEYEIEKIYYDRWRIEDFNRELEKLGVELPLEPCGQGFKDQSFCVDILESMLIDSRLRHGGHPVLTWNIANAVVDIDPAGLRKMTKRKSYGRIDGAISLGQALRIWEIEDKKEEESIYDNDEFCKKIEMLLS
jgi:phage terminase large subunit-like protein